MKKLIKISALSLVLATGHFASAQVGRSNIDSNPMANHDNMIKEMDKMIDDVQSRHMIAARSQFVTAFSEAQDAIMTGNLDKAKKPMEKLHKLQGLNKYEESRLYLIDYWYQGKLGNKEQENEAAMKLMPIGVGNVDADAYVEAGMRLLKRQYNGQNYGGAIDTLGYLRQEPKSQAELDDIAAAVKKLDEMSTSTKDIVQQIKTNDKGNWTAKLLRPTFFLDKINGEVSTIEFNCENKQVTLPYKVESVMSTPAAWGSCLIKVNATANTTFDFAQLINKPAA